MKFSLIHPSRGRPVMAKATMHKWISAMSGGNDYEYILSLDNNDRFFGSYKTIEQRKLSVIIGNNRSAVDAVNRAAEISTGEILIVVSDDFDCPENWDKKILEKVQDKTDWIMKTDDGNQKWIITLPIMDRTYYKRFGYIYLTDYLHMFVDTDMSCVADLLNRKIDALDLLFMHNDYRSGAFQMDETSAKADKTWNQGQELFIRRYKNSFGLEPDEIKGEINPHEGMNVWLKEFVK